MPSSRSAGWSGCTILMNPLPEREVLFFPFARPVDFQGLTSLKGCVSVPRPTTPMARFLTVPVFAGGHDRRAT